MLSIRLSAGSLSRLLGQWRGEDTREAAYQLLARALRLLIVDGRIGLGVRLPGERELAHALGVSRTTLTAAYEQLRENGYLLSRRGSGSVTQLPALRGAAVKADDVEGENPIIDWTAAAMPAAAGLWEAYEEALRQLPAWLSGLGYEALGLPRLREAIARDYNRRGCPTRPEQIMVTSGAQNGLTLVLRALAGPGDRIAVDHPTYHNALGAISQHYCQPVPIGLPGTGWDFDAVDAVFRQAGPRFAYLQPDYHNPTGRLMDEAGRWKLVAIAARTRTPLLIDETMVETGLAASGPAPVAAHDTEGHLVISLGSVSKRYWGGLRIGWIRASEQRIAEFGRLRAILDMTTPVLEQLAVTEMLNRDRRTNDRRALMRERCDTLIALLADALPHWRVSAPQGGLALWAELPRSDASALAAMAQSLGVRIAAGPRFAVNGGFERFVRLPFTLPEPDLQRAVKRLAQADRSLHRRAAHGPDSPSLAVEMDRMI